MTPNEGGIPDTHWMQAALAQAHAAAATGEVPVGAVVVLNGQLIASGCNTPIHTHDPSAHAEIVALRAAASHLGNYRLDQCELFVTLEPCAMCAGAMLHARLKRVVFGAPDPKTGAAGSVTNIFSLPQLNHQTQVQGGVMAEPCAALLQDFFRQQRAQSVLRKQLAGGVLREDAVRTPDERFETLPAPTVPSRFVSDLTGLLGWRLHYLDTGPAEATDGTLCLHGPDSWSEGWRSRIIQAQNEGQRLVCPDLIGFGRSDKPKKESVHTLPWHAQVLLALLDHLELQRVTLLVPDNQAELTRYLVSCAPERFVRVIPATPDTLSPSAQVAPYPDAGHRAAQRAFQRLSCLPL